MRFLFSLLLLLGSAFAADYTVNGRLIGEFSNIPANRVATVRNAMTNTIENADLLATSFEFFTVTNSGVISGGFDLQFLTGTTYSNKVFTKWQSVTNFNFPSGITGMVSLHFCALDSANTNSYVPCYSSTAKFAKKNIP